MKIIVIASLYKPYVRGGAEVVTHMIVEELKKDHEVVIIAITPWKGLQSLYPTKTHEDTARVYRFYPFNIFSFIDICAQPLFLRFFWHVLDMLNIHSAWTVFCVLKKEKPDVVMVHTIKGMGYTVPFAVRMSGIPNIHTIHDIQFVVPSGQYMYGKERPVEKSYILRIYRTLSRSLLGSPQCVVYPSHFLKDFYDKYGFFAKSKKIVLPHPTVVHTWLREIFSPRKDEAIRFLYLGQLEKHKGILFLLEVFKKLSILDTELIIAGSGSCENAVRAACSKDIRISFLGYKNGDAREEVFRRAHYLIVPSVCYENAPLVVGEALSRGIPVISAHIGGAYELIQAEKNGWIFTPKDTEHCIKILSEAHAAARMRYQELSLYAKKSSEKYSLQKYCKQLLSIGLISKHHVGAIGDAGGEISE